MMQVSSNVQDQEVAAQIVREHPHADELGSLAWQLLLKQARGRVLYAAKDFVETLASEHGVTIENATTGGGNLLAIFERGPTTAGERGLCAAFAIRGWTKAWSASSEEQRERLALDLAQVADWLETNAQYRVYSLIPMILDESTASSFWSSVQRSVTATRSDDPATRVQSIGRLVAMHHAGGSNIQRLHELAEHASDPIVRAFASSLVGSAPRREATGLAGPLAARGSRGVFRFIKVITGFAVLQWALRGFGWLLGLRRHGEVTIEGDCLRIRRVTRVLGRDIRDVNDTIPLRSLVSAGREVRFPALHLFVGLGFVSLGVLIGGLLVWDGLRTGMGATVLVGALFVFVGVLLDLGFDILPLARNGRVTVRLRFLQYGRLALRGVPLQEADDFLHTLRKRL